MIVILAAVCFSTFQKLMTYKYSTMSPKNPLIFGVRKSKVKATSYVVGLYTLVSAGFFYLILFAIIAVAFRRLLLFLLPVSSFPFSSFSSHPPSEFSCHNLHEKT